MCRRSCYLTPILSLELLQLHCYHFRCCHRRTRLTNRGVYECYVCVWLEGSCWRAYWRAVVDDMFEGYLRGALGLL